MKKIKLVLFLICGFAFSALAQELVLMTKPQLKTLNTDRLVLSAQLKFSHTEILKESFVKTDENDDLFIEGTVNINGQKEKISVHLMGYENKATGEVCVLSELTKGKQKFSEVLKGNKSKLKTNLESLRIQQVITKDNKPSFIPVTKGGYNDMDFEESVSEYELISLVNPAVSSKTYKFLQCLGKELKGECKEECSAKKVLDCALSGSAVGAMIGGALGASIGAGAGGVGAIPGGVVGVVTGSIVGFTFCMGITCGKCVFGSALYCFAFFF